MADITALVPDESGVLAASMTATSTGGDAVPALNDGSAYVFVFRNDHTVGITVNLKSQLTNQVIAGVGKVSKADQSQVVAANGGIGIFKVDKDEIAAYLDVNSKFQFTYTSWNALLKMTPIKVVI